jgi:hypothetical protein
LDYCDVPYHAQLADKDDTFVETVFPLPSAIFYADPAAGLLAAKRQSERFLQVLGVSECRESGILEGAPWRRLQRGADEDTAE